LQEMLDVGADDYLAKPLDLKLFRIRLSIAETQVENLLRRREAEANLAKAFSELEQSHDDLLSILNQLRQGTAITNEHDQVTFLSQKAEGLLGIKENRVLGKKWESVFPFEKDLRLQLIKMSSQPPGHREKIAASVKREGEVPSWLEVEVQDDPRSPLRKIFHFHDVSEVHDLRRQLDEKAHFHDIVGKSKAMRKVYGLIRDLANVETTVLIQGETGTGKELVARAIHFTSTRKKKPFIAVNCAGLTESLVSSQLFGYRKGAFTGAVDDHEGLFEAANGGTLFLDEIGDVPMNTQISLLRVLEARELTRVGETTPRKIDVRVLTATNHDLEQLVEEGEFRRDLLYRIRIARITLPDLRQRREDIPLLVEWFLRETAAATGRTFDGVAPGALAALSDYSWPGNVRELRNAVEFAVIHGKGKSINARDLPPEIRRPKSEPALKLNEFKTEKEAIVEALRRSRGNRSKAAQLMGVSRATFYRRLDELDIELGK
jgi:PAS domain S-box-containing protein